MPKPEVASACTTARESQSQGRRKKEEGRRKRRGRLTRRKLPYMGDQNQSASADARVGGAVVVFAKCPIAGASKTRLAPLLGTDGAALLARAMLSDVLVSLSKCPLLANTLKVLVYAPGTKSGESHMISILQSLQLPYQEIDFGPLEAQQSDQINGPSNEKIPNIDINEWVLLPMMSSAPTSPNDDLTSSSLGDKLQDALERTRKLIAIVNSHNTYNNMNEAVMFLGMDSPELPMEEIVYGLQISSGNESPLHRNEPMPINDEQAEQSCTDNETKTSSFRGKAHMCPANDGGYGLLSVPKHASSSQIFSGVTWSDSLTAVSQLKALTDSNVDVSIGRLMHDVDEPADVKDLVIRLTHTVDDEHKNKRSSSESQSYDSLANLSSGIRTIVLAGVQKSYPHHTLNALVDLNMIQK